ncbi:uncharacterized protein LOC135387772 isoform X3 [Ornithodoros turicata]|uniref:uncharacterized protein LOC135387772 isoform X3 n=1 Tax=Ornithodoros turicata TaxID=34597 RepID=UPI003138B203
MAFHRRAEYLLLLFSVTSFVYHWLVLGIILAFLLTLIADPVKLEGEEYFVLFYGDLHQSSWFRPAMLSFSVFCLASQILSITSAASLIKAARKRTSINGSVLLMLTSGIPRLVWIVKIFLWAVFSFYALQYSKKKRKHSTQTMTATTRTALPQISSHLTQELCPVHGLTGRRR